MTKKSTIILPLLAFLTNPLITLAEDADDSIFYWTDYAILPKRCITYNSNDMIMYSMYNEQSNHCTDTPLGTYITTVPTFVSAYLEQLANNANDANTDYTYPDIASYVDCTYKQIGGVDYYLQVGCADDNPLGIAVNIYSDAQCTALSSINGYDDANIEIDLSIQFQKCTPCVIWMDKNDDEIDDQYYENKMTTAPLCSASWSYKQECNGKCQMMARESKTREGWNRADKVLLSILSLFGKWIEFCK